MLEMLDAFVIKFRKHILDEHFNTILMHLVVCLANDNDNKFRSMTGTVIKLLIGRVSKNLIGEVEDKERRPILSILEFSLSWYSSGEEHVRSAAAQVKKFKTYIMSRAFFSFKFLEKNEPNLPLIWILKFRCGDVNQNPFTQPYPLTHNLPKLPLLFIRFSWVILDKPIYNWV